MTNWGEVFGDAGEESASDLVPASSYDARVKEANAKKASTGSDMIEIVFAIVGGPQDDQWIWSNLVLPKADSKPGHRKMFARRMRALGFDMASLTANNPSLQQVADQMVGRSVRIEVIHKPWEGNQRAEVKSISPISGAGTVPSAPTVDAPPIPQVPDVPQVPEIPTAPPAASPPVAAAAQPVAEPTPVVAPEPTTPPDEAPF